MNIIPDWRILIVQGAGFLLVLLVFKFFLFKPIMDVLDARRQDVADSYSKAEGNLKDAEELKAEYQKHLAEIDEEMRTKIAQAVKEGQAMREEIVAESREKAEAILTKAQEEIRREKDVALAELRSTVATLAVDAAGKLIEENLDEKKHRELVDKFIDNVGEVRG